MSISIEDPLRSCLYYWSEMQGSHEVDYETLCGNRRRRTTRQDNAKRRTNRFEWRRLCISRSQAHCATFVLKTTRTKNSLDCQDLLVWISNCNIGDQPANAVITTEVSARMFTQNIENIYP